MDDLMENVVEEAPEAFDIDELLGLSDIDLEDTSTNDVQILNSDNIEVDEPHIKIPTKKLLDVLKVSTLISSAGENSFEGKIIVLKVEEGKVRFLISDNKRNIEKEVELLNTENQFTGTVAFNAATIARLTKVCTSIFTLVERKIEDENSEKVNKKYVLKIRGGELFLDNIQINENKFLKDFSDNTIAMFNKEEVSTTIKRLFSYASTAIKSGKNIDFLGKVIQAAPINSLAKYYSNSDYPKFKISLTDARILYTLCITDGATELGISSNGKIFTGESFKFKTETFAATDCAFDTVAERMFSGEAAVIDAQHLIQITELSCSLDSSIGSVRFNYNDGRVECELLTKRENSTITLQGIANEDLVKLDKAIEVPSSNLKGALTIFSQETTLQFRVTTDGVSIESGNIKVAILGKGVGK